MRHWSGIFVLSVIVVSASTTEGWGGSGRIAGMEHTVHGEVVAVNVTDPPYTIVVRSNISGNREMIVGANVEKDATVVRGEQRVSLAGLKPGDKVTLVYVKHEKGLTARSIQVEK